MLRSLFKGWLGEKVTQAGMWLKLDAGIYQRFHDVVVPSRNGTTQIDHVLVSIYGVFVLETKNYDGWIFGDEHAAKWTVSHFRKKFQFQNPLRQNFRHIQCLSEHLRLDAAKFHSVVFFIGDAELKTPLPRNVVAEGLSSYIRSFTAPIINPESVVSIVGALAALKANPTLTKAHHLESLASRHGSNTVCPNCGSPLVQRVARSGANAGRPFLGCGSYPRCRFTKAIG
jgi:restriction system protein